MNTTGRPLDLIPHIIGLRECVDRHVDTVDLAVSWLLQPLRHTPSDCYMIALFESYGNGSWQCICHSHIYENEGIRRAPQSHVHKFSSQKVMKTTCWSYLQFGLKAAQSQDEKNKRYDECVHLLFPGVTVKMWKKGNTGKAAGRQSTVPHLLLSLWFHFLIEAVIQWLFVCLWQTRTELVGADCLKCWWKMKRNISSQIQAIGVQCDRFHHWNIKNVDYLIISSFCLCSL